MTIGVIKPFWMRTKWPVEFSILRENPKAIEMRGEPGLSDLSALSGKQVDSNSDDFQQYFDQVSLRPGWRRRKPK